ncbi:MAG TPA: hypothetical protein VHI33_04605 [Solirubrobacterales bacterium]|nr:hypothetical protein [Solirubrobacterales bacterium]
MDVPPLLRGYAIPIGGPKAMIRVTSALGSSRVCENPELRSK